MIRTGDVTSSEVVNAHLVRIAEVNPSVNAVTVTLADDARAAAAAVDRAVATTGFRRACNWSAHAFVRTFCWMPRKRSRTEHRSSHPSSRALTRRDRCHDESE
jgi:hypothetical protein